MTARAWTLLGSLLIGVLLMTACSGQATPPAANVKITLAPDPSPPVTGTGLLLVTLNDAANRPVDDATVEVEGNMTHPGMAPMVSTVKGGRAGTYHVPFDWSMAGDWVLTVTATLPDGSRAQQDFSFSVASP